MIGSIGVPRARHDRSVRRGSATNTQRMFSNVNLQRTSPTTTTITAQAELAAFSSETGCPARVSTEPVDPRYAHSAALGRRQQDTSHKRARRCQECTRPLSAECTGRYCAECDPSGPPGDLWSAQDTAEPHTRLSGKAGLQQGPPEQTKKSASLKSPRAHAWEDENCEQQDTVHDVSASERTDDDEVPDEWDAENK
eukprot:COSAG02_NODE_821_length_16794_cov_42.795747_18_plen_196_part_00